MNKVTQGVAYTLVDQFNSQLLPRARDLEMTLDSGAPLGPHDIDHMLAILRNLRSIYPVVARLPEYRELEAGVFSLVGRLAGRACEAESATRLTERNVRWNPPDRRGID